jgi:hypothetical protein
MELIAVGENAVGVIAIGQHATGFFALGQIATGVIAIGQCARGFVAVGQLAVGVFAVGMLGFGVFSTIAMLSFGVHSCIGMLAIGGSATGMSQLSVFPKFTPDRYALPSCNSWDDLSPEQPGWVEVEGRERHGGAELFMGIRPLQARISSRVFRHLSKAVREGARLFAHIRFLAGEPIVDELVTVPVSPPRTHHPVVLVLRFLVVLAIATVVWLGAIQPVIVGYFGG